MVKTKAHDYAKNGNTNELIAEIKRNPSVIDEIDNVSIILFVINTINTVIIIIIIIITFIYLFSITTMIIIVLY